MLKQKPYSLIPVLYLDQVWLRLREARVGLGGDSWGSRPKACLGLGSLVPGLSSLVFWVWGLCLCVRAWVRGCVHACVGVWVCRCAIACVGWVWGWVGV